MLLGTVSLAAVAVANAQRAPSPPSAALPVAIPAAATPGSALVPPQNRTAPASCQNADAIGVARVVEIDTTGGPGFGSEHFKAYDFLRMNEVVLTFDDGPWPNTTAAVLAALAAQCTKATFFPIGKHATWHPEILKQVAEQGHTIGSHTWSHADMSKKSAAEAKDEIEKGVSAVRAALNTPAAPFFRFPNLKHPAELVAYLGERNIGIFSTDMDSFDFKIRKPEQVVQSVMAKLKKHGKGIVLLHDFQHPTAEALPELLNQLKASGYKIVHMKAKQPVTTIASYDAMMAKEIQGVGNAARPISNVVRTISGE
jgi:peptidoglycan/xylan/chitin deacetylase (PgdA/CDA1 family)